MYSVNEKILSFLNEAGYEVEPSTSAGLQLLRFFESEYGVEIMGMLEAEWFEEQAGTALSAADFAGVRDQLDHRMHGEFDLTIEQIFTGR